MEKYEVIKELIYWVEAVEHPIRGRIVKNIITGISEEYPFGWEVSHYCAIPHEMDVYKPSGTYGRDIEDAENGLDRYIKRFEEQVSIKPNKYY